MKYIFAVLLLLASAPLCLAATIHVPADQPTIQAGIDAAVDGDTVLVAPGTYTESITLPPIGLFLISEGGRDVTTVMPTSSGNLLSYSNGTQSENLLQGFTFTGLQNGSCVNIWNSARIYVLDNRFIENNVANGAVQVVGGDCTIRGNEFVANHSVLHGGGVRLQSDGASLVEYNLFESNSANYGGGIDLLASQAAVVKNNLFIEDTAGAYGGAVYLGGSVDVMVHNNTIDACVSLSSEGAGISFWSCTDAVSFNNIILNCEGYGVWQSGTSSSVSNYEDLYDNSPGDYFSISPGDQSISLDALFAGGDPFQYLLTEDSPCIDAGNPDPQYDDPDGTRNDMGAFPYEIECRGWVLNVPAEYSTIQEAVDSAYDCDTILIQEGLYSEVVTVTSRDLTFIGSLEGDSTIIQGRIVATNSEITLNKLAIRGGTADEGGAVSIVDGSLLVDSVVISDCSAIDGGAIYVTGDALQVLNSTISSVEANGSGSRIARGGGVYAAVSRFEIEKCLVEGTCSHTAYTPTGASAQGGALYADADSVSIKSCRINGQATSYASTVGGIPSSFGGAAYLTSSYTEMLESQFAGLATATSSIPITGTLSARARGGSVYIAGTAANLQNCNLSGSCVASAEGPDPDCLFPPEATGGAIYLVSGISAVVNQCIFFNSNLSADCNHDPGNAVIALGSAIYSEGLTAISCSHFWSNGIDEIVGDVDTSYLFRSDPRFCDESAGDTGITNCSPCLPENNDCGILIGAYDVGCSEYCGPVWYVSTSGDDNTGDGTETLPFATIQRAVDRSYDGDSVIVLPGSYSGEGNQIITADGKAILVKGSGADSTILWCEADGEGGDIYGFYLESSANSSAVIEDLTVRDADVGLWSEGSSVSCTGVAFDSCVIGVRSYGETSLINCLFSASQDVGMTTGPVRGEKNSVVEIRACEFQNNSIGARFYSSGIAVVECEFSGNDIGVQSSAMFPDGVVFDSCLFDGNATAILGTVTILNSSLLNGIQGIRLQSYNGTGPFIAENCIIEGMTGSALRLYDAGVNLVANSIIRNNPGLIAEGVYDALSALVLTDCALTGNGGGVSYTGSIQMSNCLYAENAGPVAVPEGATIKSCTFTSNRSSAMHLLAGSYNTISICSTTVSNNAGCGIHIEDYSGNYSIECCDVWDNVEGDYCGISDQTGFNGNISRDPRFCDTTNGDYSITDCSPCLPEHNECGVLIGAYYEGCYEYCGPGWYVSTTGSDETGDGSESLPFATIRKAVDRSYDGDSVIIMPGTYSGVGNTDVDVHAKSIVIAGQLGSGTTILDGSGSASGFLINGSTAGSNPVIANLALKNLSIGVNADSSSPILESVFFDSCDAAVNSFHANPELYNCSVENSGTAIQLFSSQLVVDSCDFAGNGNGIDLVLGQTVSIQCKNSTFVGHSGYAILTGLGAFPPAVQIDSCVFLNNENAVFGSFLLTNSFIDGGVNGVGADLTYPDDDFDVANCTIQNLSGQAFRANNVTHISDCTIRHIAGKIATGSDVFYITDCVIDSCEGDGIFVGGEMMSFAMSGCTYSNNAGGILLGGFLASGSIGSCDFLDNSPAQLISANFDQGFAMSNCLFAGNSGDCVILGGAEAHAVSACTFVGNLGTAIRGSGPPVISLHQNLVAFGSAGGIKIELPELTDYSITCCDVYANAGGNYVDIPDQTGLNGNISVDPWFCDTANGDYSISDCSPCAPANNECGVLIGALDVGCDLYCGPVWHVAIDGSDETGDGSLEAPFRTIQHAHDFAPAGDTVLASAGSYEPVHITKPMAIGGNSSRSAVTIDGGDTARCIFVDSVSTDTVRLVNLAMQNGHPDISVHFGQGGGLLAVASNVKLAGCDISGNTSDDAGGGFCFRDSSYFEIEDCMISNNQAGGSGGAIVAIHTKGCSISGSLMHDNSAALNGGAVFLFADAADPSRTHTFSGCTVARNTGKEGGSGIGSLRTDMEIDNSIVASNLLSASGTEAYGIYAALCDLQMSCSDIWGNESADLYADGTVDSSVVIWADPQFCDADNENFGLMHTSPCAPDNNDCELLIGYDSVSCQGTPEVISMEFTSEADSLHLTNHTPEFVWQFYDPVADSQYSFEIAVGTDDDWEYAEMWNPAPFLSSTPSIVYNGSPLSDGTTYWSRLRINNGFIWSDWLEMAFRMNSIPTVPTLALPAPDELVSTSSPRLVVLNSSDAESDSLQYTFEVSPDSFASVILPFAASAMEGDSTWREVDSTLEEDTRYWWRAAATDFYESSELSEARAFYVNAENAAPSDFWLDYPPDTAGTPLNLLRPEFVWEPSVDPDPLDAVLFSLFLALDSGFTFVNEISDISEPVYQLTYDLERGTRYWWKVRADDNYGGATWSANILSFRVMALGDANGDGITNITDAVYIIQYIFGGGLEPVPLLAGDENCDGLVNITDAVYLIQYIFNSGPPPCDPDWDTQTGKSRDVLGGQR